MSLSREQIIRMAREAGFIVSEYTGGKRLGETSIFDHAGVDIFNGLKRFTDFVAAKKSDIGMAEAYRCGYESGAAAEREECLSTESSVALSPALFASISEWKAYKNGADSVLDAIRARGNGGEK